MKKELSDKAAKDVKTKRIRIEYTIHPHVHTLIDLN